MLFKRKNPIVNVQTVKLKTDKIMRRITRDAKKRIKRDELFDAHSLALYLRYIDSQYEHLRSEIYNTTTVANYDALRASKIASIREGLGFYNAGIATLERLETQLRKSAIEAGRADSLTHDSITPPDMTELERAFRKLTGEPEPSTDQKLKSTVPPKPARAQGTSVTPRPVSKKPQGVKIQ